jgi:hypothetical protein
VHVPWGVVAAVEEKVVSGSTHVLLWCKDLRLVCVAFEGQRGLQTHLAQKLVKAVQSLAFTNGTSREGGTFAFRSLFLKKKPPPRFSSASRPLRTPSQTAFPPYARQPSPPPPPTSPPNPTCNHPPGTARC